MKTIIIKIQSPKQRKPWAKLTKVTKDKTKYNRKQKFKEE